MNPASRSALSTAADKATGCGAKTSTAHRPLDRGAARRGKRLALAVLAMADFIVILDASIVNVALPSIGRGLGLSQSGLSWVVNAYVLTFGGFLLLGGRAADLLGRRRVFIASLAVFSASIPGRRAAVSGRT